MIVDDKEAGRLKTLTPLQLQRDGTVIITRVGGRLTRDEHEAADVLENSSVPRELLDDLDRFLTAQATTHAETVITNSIGMKLVLVPAGEFLMGGDDGESDEKPTHRVRRGRRVEKHTAPATIAGAQRESLISNRETGLK